jgi:hypothetical protein
MAGRVVWGRPPEAAGADAGVAAIGRVIGSHLTTLILSSRSGSGAFGWLAS